MLMYINLIHCSHQVAASNDKFRKTLVRKATILKKGVSFSQAGTGVTRRARRAAAAADRQSSYTSDKQTDSYGESYSPVRGNPNPARQVSRL